jgi:hypothetical protein
VGLLENRHAGSPDQGPDAADRLGGQQHEPRDLDEF